MTDTDIKKEDLGLVKEAISLWEEGLKTKQKRLMFLGLVNIIEHNYIESMKRINNHISGLVINIITINLNTPQNTSRLLTALRYTLGELKSEIERNIE